MTEKIEYKGYWWLPSNPDATVAGVLTYTPNEKITLELIGSFDSNEDPIRAFLDKKTESVIHGFTSDSEEITLINCHASGSVNFSCPFPIIRYNCKFVIIGKRLQNFEQKCFYKAYVTIPVLTYWCPPATLETTIQFNEKGKIEATSISFKSKIEAINNTRIDDNTQLIIKEGVNYEGDHFSPKLEQCTYLEIVKQCDTSIRDLYANIFMYEQFLSLATLQTAKCSKIVLFDKSVCQELDNGKKHYHPIQLIYIQRDVNESPKSKKHDFLFDYSTIAKQYPQIIQKWYTEKEDIAPIRAHLIDSIKNKRVFSSVDFLIVIQAIEGFWWRFRDDEYKIKNNIPKDKDTKLRTIITELKKEFKSIDKIRKTEWDVKNIVDSRHYYSHFFHKSKKTKALDGVKLYKLTQKLRKLLICCVLNFLGFENNHVNLIFNKSNNDFVDN